MYGAGDIINSALLLDAPVTVFGDDTDAPIALTTPDDLAAAVRANSRLDLSPEVGAGLIGFLALLQERAGAPVWPLPPAVVLRAGERWLGVLAASEPLAAADVEALTGADPLTPIPLVSAEWSIYSVAHAAVGYSMAELREALAPVAAPCPAELSVDQADLPVVQGIAQGVMLRDFGPGELERSQSLRVVVMYGANKQAKRWVKKEETVERIVATAMQAPIGAKDGRGWVFGDLDAENRKKDAVYALTMATLDVDDGPPPEEVERRLMAEPWLSFLHTTHSHLSEETILRRDDVVMWARRQKDPAIRSDEGLKREETVRAFLVERTKFSPERAAEATIEEVTERGRWFHVHHAPIHKYRIAIFMDQPFVPSAGHNTTAEGLAAWRRYLRRLAKRLGLRPDASGFDANRLYFTPRRRSADAVFRASFFGGRPMSLSELDGGDDADGDDAANPRRELTDAARGMKRWAAQHPGFDMLELVRDLAPERVHEDHGEKLVVVCPCDDEHSNAGDPSDRGCVLMQGPGGSGWTVACRHGACGGRDRLEFLAAMLGGEQPWFTLEDLENEAYDSEQHEPEIAEDLDPSLMTGWRAPRGTPRAAEGAARGISTPPPSRKVREFKGGATPLKNTSSSSWPKLLERLNREGALVSIGPKIVVAVHKFDGDYIWFAKADAATHFAPFEFIPVDEEGKAGKPIPAFPKWLKDPARRRYNGVVCDPAEQNPPDILNTWTSFEMEPVEGDCGLMLDHILHAMCGGDEKLFYVVLCWMAHMFQRPWEKPGFAIVVQSEERGLGKSLLGVWLRKMIGRIHSIKLSQPKHITGQFNSQIDGKLLIDMSEVTFGGDKAGEGIVKDLITETSIAVEAKYMAPVESTSFCRCYVTTNERHAIRVGRDERRFLFTRVVDVHAGLPLDAPERKNYYDALTAQANGGGAAALMHHLMAYDIAGFDRFRPPKTVALGQQAELTLSDDDQWVLGILTDGVFTLRDGEVLGDEGVWEVDKTYQVSAADLQRSYHSHVKRYGGSSGGTRAAVRALSAHGDLDRFRLSTGDRGYAYELGPRRVWQEAFTGKFGVQFEPENVVSLQRARGQRGGG